MGSQAPSKVKFELIEQALAKDNNKLCVSGLCNIAGVSRSGYYNWISKKSKRDDREKQDKLHFELILDAYKHRGYDKGAKGIHMRLLHKKKRMNLKKIRRLMSKYGLFCKIRQENPYRKMIRAIKTSHVSDNIVDRKFTERGARQVLLTDITYIKYRNNMCYLSTILDAYTHEILAYQVSDNLRVDFVLATLDKLIAKHGCVLDNSTIVHSDQGCHYTSNAFVEKLRSESFVQSMSRKGNCWDNAPQESFFGHMKDEVVYYIEKCETIENVKERIADWMDYYNNERYQWELLKLSPTEYYEYVTTGHYPITV